MLRARHRVMMAARLYNLLMAHRAVMGYTADTAAMPLVVVHRVVMAVRAVADQVVDTLVGAHKVKTAVVPVEKVHRAAMAAQVGMVPLAVRASVVNVVLDSTLFRLVAHQRQSSEMLLPHRQA